MIFNKQQQEAIDTRNKDILLSASAGSGKTTVMIQRVVSLLKEGHDLSDMLIVTFTKAAAADMKEKLANALTKHKTLKPQLLKLADADISTIHSWCKKIIEQYFYLINVDPDVKLAENERLRMQKKAVDRVIADYKAEDAKQAFFEIEEIFSDNIEAKDLRNIVIKLIEDKSIRPEQEDIVLGDEHCKKLLLEKIEIKKAALKQKTDLLYQDALMVNFVRNIIPIKELSVALELSTTNITTAKGPIGKEAVFICINNDYKKLKDEVFELVEKEQSIINSKTQNTDYIAALHELRQRAIKELNKIKQKKGVLDFNDLERLVFEILKTDALTEIRKKYKFIFVDEYQDINPLQHQIIHSLKHEKNNLFLVGDIKQSIYAFRGCEPSIFLGLYNEYKEREDAVAIELNANYRSQKEILMFSNKLFSQIMTKDFGGVDYKREGAFFIDETKGDKACGTKVQIHLGKQQTQAAALKIANLLAFESIKPSDIAVLVRSDTKSLVPLYDELSKIGIKVSLPKKDIFVQHLINYLKLINNRFNDVSLVNVLLGPFGNFSDIELAKIRTEFKDEKYFYEAADKSTNQKIKNFFTVLNDYREFSLKINALDLINQIISEQSYFNKIFAFGDANSFEAFLSSLGERRHLSLFELLNEGLEAGELAAEDDAIKVMTAHRAKGLEFEYVLILNTNKRFNLTDLSKSVLVHKGATAIKAYDFENGQISDSGAHLYIKDGLKKEQLEEEMRLLYVACTRAKRGLDIFAGVEEDAMDDEENFKQSDRAASWWDWLKMVWSEYACNENFIEEADIKQGIVKQKILPPADIDSAKKLQASMDRKHAIDITPPKVYVTQAVKMKHEEGVDESNVPMLFLDDQAADKSNAELGTLYHEAMEAIDFFADFDSEWGRLHNAIKDKTDKFKIKKAVEAMKELIGDKKYYKEQGFILKVDAGEFGGAKGNFVLMQGVIDLIILDNDASKAVIVDYKTGRGDREEYKKQLYWYKKAALEVLNIKNVDTKLYLFD